MIGILTDTHDNEFAIKKAVKVFRQKQVELVVHCGDIICPAMLEDFQGLNMRLVFGNCDGEREGLNKKAKKFGFEEITAQKEFQHRGKRFWVYHGKDRQKLQQKIDSQEYDYILTGHTHKFRDERVGKTRIINTGPLWLREPHQRVGLLDAEKDHLELVDLT